MKPFIEALLEDWRDGKSTSALLSGLDVLRHPFWGDAWQQEASLKGHQWLQLDLHTVAICFNMPQYEIGNI